MVVEAAFTIWTADRLLRHPSFEGSARINRHVTSYLSVPIYTDARGPDD
jgi:hypothetical protein